MGASAPTRISGGCLCGAVRYTATTNGLHVDACHCGMCRKWSAGPMFAMNGGNSVKVADESKLGVYASSDWAERCFCKTCGASMFYRMKDRSFWAISAETVDERSGFVFTTEIFVDDKPSYYDFANKTKKMTGADVMAAFGSAGAEK